MTAPPRPAGSAMWLDLTVADIDAARSFYQSFLGWKLTEQHTPMGTYVIAATDQGEVGGMMAQDPQMVEAGVPAAWTVVFAVDEIDAAYRRVLDLGGTSAAAPFEIPGGDRIAYVADPAGASFAIMEASQAEGGIVWGEAGAASWVECQSREPERSQAFYESLFGWKPSSGETDYVVFASGSDQVAGLMEMPPQVPAGVPSHWMVYWTVDDVDAAAARAGELGATVVAPPMTVEGMRFAVVDDPQGAVFGLLTPQG